MTAKRSAIVIGGSLGGLLAANLLHRAGWDVHVFERAAAALESRGAGLVTHPEMMDVLAKAGVPIESDIGVRVEYRVALDNQNSHALTLAYPQVFTAWSKLYELLKAAFPVERYHAGKNLVGFSQDAASVRAEFQDGERATADLLIAADGIRSRIRQHFLPQVHPEYAGYVAWRGLVDEAALSQAAQSELFPYFAFGLPAGEQMLGYPVAGRANSLAPGRRRYNFVWYRPVEHDALADMNTDAAGHLWRDGIPPPAIRPDVMASARAAARALLPPHFAEVVEKADLFFQPIFDLESPKLAFDRIVLLGDSAFVARPHCGMGVTKAAGDAAALVQWLDAVQPWETALSAYETQRVAVGTMLVRHARALGAYMQAQLSTPEAVLRETAVPLA